MFRDWGYEASCYIPLATSPPKWSLNHTYLSLVWFLFWGEGHRTGPQGAQRVRPCRLVRNIGDDYKASFRVCGPFSVAPVEVRASGLIGRQLSRSFPALNPKPDALSPCIHSRVECISSALQHRPSRRDGTQILAERWSPATDGADTDSGE